ncbi:MAG: hypothetical protein Q9160_004547 [Pyrenula sp. 1 TL-2023]
MSAVGSRRQSAAGHNSSSNENTHEQLLGTPEYWPMYPQNLQSVDQNGLLPSDNIYPQTTYPLNQHNLSTSTYFEAQTHPFANGYSDLNNQEQNNNVTGINGVTEAGSAFTPSELSNIDLLTPEQSDNFHSDYSTHNTPILDDVQWQAQPLLNASNGPAIDQSFDISELDTSKFAIPSHSQLVDGFPEQRSNQPNPIAPQLLSPQLTNTTNSPSPPAKRYDFSFGHTPAEKPSTVKPMVGRRSYRPPGIQVVGQPTPGQSGASSSNSGHASPLEPIHRAVSPSIMVSSYNRGDSPRRTDFLSNRSVGKRSRASSRASSLLSPQPQEDSSDEELDPLESSNRHAGIEPASRGDALVNSSINMLAAGREIDEKKAEVEDWLSKSEAGSETEDASNAADYGPQRGRSKKNRIRAHSMGTRSGDVEPAIFDDSSIPGPGILLDESEGEEEDEDSEFLESLPDSPVADLNTVTDAADPGYFPPTSTDQDEQEPLPKQFYRPQYWQDPSTGEPIFRREDEPKDQPFSSNAAMMRFQHQAARFETASRAATWGTGRRMSDSEMNAMVGPDGTLRKLSLQERVRERKSSIMNQASRLVPRRSGSNLRRKDAEASQVTQSPDSTGGAKKRGESLTSLKALQRMSSMSKPTSPPLNTGSALMAMTGQIAAVGGSNSVGTAPSPSGPTGTWTKSIKRTRSKSDIPFSSSKPKGTPNLSQLMTNLGGPPMLNLTSPVKESLPEPAAIRQSTDEEEEEEEEDDENMEGQGIKMDLKIRVDPIVPNLDGFKTHVRQLNPRLHDFLVDRIATEQIRRYKKLLENKVKHTHAVNVTKKCGSGHHCFQLGGEATMLPLRTSAKDPETTYAQFQINVPGEEEDESTTFSEGAVTAALFPPGIPLPPVKRLPAEFECTLCYKVKKFQKPSDWTKHVHEDVQPFTCTFPNCTEPKSFKRKADWVRHENERHRQLEWWQCSMPECNHVCYRKDNFVQHLVREHKKPEPKVKSRGSASSKAKPVRSVADTMGDWHARVYEQEVEEVWKLVETCRHDTAKKPKDEACKFCGNVCNSWKKLTVHLAKHMEQIAMPVLDLVRQKDVSPNMTISPIDRISGRGQQHTHRSSVSNQKPKIEPSSGSPYLDPNSALQQNSMQSGPFTGPASEFYEPTSQQQQQMFESPGYGPQMPLHQQEMSRYPQSSEPPYTMRYAYADAQTPQSQFQPVNNPSATSYPPPYNAGHRSSPNTMHPHSARVQFPSQGNAIPTSIYGQQPTQDVYSSPTDGVAYGDSGNPFEIAMTQAHGISGMTTYDGSQSGIAGSLPYGHGQGQPGIGFDILQGQQGGQGQGQHSGAYGYQQQ